MRETLYDLCVRTGKTELLGQWDAEKNGGLTPEDLSYGSRRSVWWRCAQGHQWQAMIYSRSTNHSGCPICAGKQVLPGVNDLASRFPLLALQWDREKNAPCLPSDVLPGSHRRVWWQCDHGHGWQAEIKSRVSGCGCPICTNRAIRPGSNDLAAAFPKLARQWHPTRNETLKPSDVFPGSSRKVWWRCEKGHEWQASVAARTGSGAGCPVCAGKKIVAGENDLSSRFPALAAQWDGEENGSLTPEQVSPYSNRRVWWRCVLGHRWQAAVSARTMHGSGCPYCAGKRVLPGFNDLATRQPRLAAQWHPSLNGALTPEAVSPGSHQKVWWQCGEGHVWQARVFSRAGAEKCGCPVCAGRIKQSAALRKERMLLGSASPGR